MNVEEIPIFPVVTSPSNFINDNRLEAPEYLRILIEQVAGIQGLESLQELSQGDITTLLGGKMSIIYGVRVRGRWVVVKFRSRGGQAEAEALKAWNRVGASVVQVIAHGVIAQGRSSEEIKYLVMEAAVDIRNDIAKTAQEYLGDYPSEAEGVARPLGEALAGMHRAVDVSGFGEFADMGEKKEGESAWRDWAGYLAGYVEKHIHDLLRLGFPRRKIEALKQRVGQLEFPNCGVVLHGDFSARNSVLVSREPYQIKVFDPNPIIGHPSWDFAILGNNVDFSKRRAERCPDRQDLKVKLEMEEATLEGVLQGYRAAGGENCGSDAIAAAQLMQCLYLLPQKVWKAQKEGKRPADDLESQVVRDTLSEKIGMLTR